MKSVGEGKENSVHVGATTHEGWGPGPLGWREKGPDHTPRWDICADCALSKLTPRVQKDLSMIVCRWSDSQR